jgi:uncharacterized membrane protein
LLHVNFNVRGWSVVDQNLISIALDRAVRPRRVSPVLRGVSDSTKEAIMQTSHLAGTAALAALLVAQAAGATTYHVVNLGPGSDAAAMNRKGDIAGELSSQTALYARGAWHARNDLGHGSRATAIDDMGDMVGFEYHGGHRNPFPIPMYYPRGGRDYAIPLPAGADPAGPENLGNGISPDGTQVVGTYRNQASGQHCFVWHPGDASAIDLAPPPGYSSCLAAAINDAGVIVGQVDNTAFVYEDGQFQPVGLGGIGVLRVVNGKGHAVGEIMDWPVHWDGHHLRRIRGTGALQMNKATAINDRDEIVGNGGDGSYSTLLMYADGVIVDLVPLIDNPAGWNFAGAPGPTGINERGEISGSAGYDDGSGLQGVMGYLLVPDD